MSTKDAERAEPLKCQCGGTINIKDHKGRWMVCPLPRGRKCTGIPDAKELEPWE